MFCKRRNTINIVEFLSERPNTINIAKFQDDQVLTLKTFIKQVY